MINLTYLYYRVDDIVKENDDLKRRAETYETSNRSLISQLNKLQQLVKRISPKHVTAQTTTCLMVCCGGSTDSLSCLGSFSRR